MPMEDSRFQRTSQKKKKKKKKKKEEEEKERKTAPLQGKTEEGIIS